jgi:hypothetical protein
LLPSFLTESLDPGGQAAAGTDIETTATSIAKENAIRDDGDVMVTSNTDVAGLPWCTARDDV